MRQNSTLTKVGNDRPKRGRIFLVHLAGQGFSCKRAICQCEPDCALQGRKERAGIFALLRCITPPRRGDTSLYHPPAAFHSIPPRQTICPHRDRQRLGEFRANLQLDRLICFHGCSVRLYSIGEQRKPECFSAAPAKRMSVRTQLLYSSHPIRCVAQTSTIFDDKKCCASQSLLRVDRRHVRRRMAKDRLGGVPTARCLGECRHRVP